MARAIASSPHRTSAGLAAEWDLLAEEHAVIDRLRMTEQHVASQLSLAAERVRSLTDSLSYANSDHSQLAVQTQELRTTATNLRNEMNAQRANVGREMQEATLTFNKTICEAAIKVKLLADGEVFNDFRCNRHFLCDLKCIVDSIKMYCHQRINTFIGHKPGLNWSQRHLTFFCAQIRYG